MAVKTSKQLNRLARWCCNEHVAHYILNCLRPNFGWNWHTGRCSGAFDAIWRCFPRCYTSSSKRGRAERQRQVRLRRQISQDLADLSAVHGIHQTPSTCHQHEASLPVASILAYCRCRMSYGVATVSRIDSNISLFCRILSFL